MKKMHEVDRIKIEQQFSQHSGISKDLILEFTDAFPISPTCHIMLLDREFTFDISIDGKSIKKGTIKEVK